MQNKTSLLSSIIILIAIGMMYYAYFGLPFISVMEMMKPSLWDIIKDTDNLPLDALPMAILILLPLILSGLTYFACMLTVRGRIIMPIIQLIELAILVLFLYSRFSSGMRDTSGIKLLSGFWLYFLSIITIMFTKVIDDAIGDKSEDNMEENGINEPNPETKQEPKLESEQKTVSSSETIPDPNLTNNPEIVIDSTAEQSKIEPQTIFTPEYLKEPTSLQSNNACSVPINRHEPSQKGKKLMLVVVCSLAAILIVSGLIYFFLRQSPIQFETFETDESLESPYDGGIAGMSLSIDYPIGEGERQANIAKGIRQIMSETSVGQEVGILETNSIKEICYSMIENFRKGVKDESLMGATSYELMIKKEYQNSKAVFFCVSDGIFSNGGPQETYKVVRISDGSLMKADELYYISNDEAENLLKKYAPKDDDTDFSFMTEAYLSRDSLEGKIIMFCLPHFYNSYSIPLEELAPYLTEEGRNLFDINSEMPAAKPRIIDEHEQLTTDVQSTEYENIDENEDEDINKCVEADKHIGPIMLDYSGKLGPIQVGQKYSDLPESYSGLYDKSYYHELSKAENYKWGYSLFMKDGHEVFRLDIRNDIIEAISLSEYSSYIKTSDGFFVGYPARELFVKKRMKWENNGEDYWGNSGPFWYFITANDLVNPPVLQKESDIKPSAKIRTIQYNK